TPRPDVNSGETIYDKIDDKKVEMLKKLEDAAIKLRKLKMEAKNYGKAQLEPEIDEKEQE
ncbi:MAG: hypothetical protein NTZ97_04925, partial [Candidatus Moranbacteria bacterium]|nr:hypothetical protein [Candidatus Moranbacteria bacterium]